VHNALLHPGLQQELLMAAEEKGEYF